MASTLKGSTNIYAAINVLDDPRPYGATTSRSGQFYYLGQVNGVGFTCSKEFYDAFKAGTLEQVSFSDVNEYERTLADGTKRPAKGVTLGGYLTKAQVIAQLKGDKELFTAKAQLDATVKVAGKLAEREAYKDAGIDATEMKELMGLLA